MKTPTHGYNFKPETRNQHLLLLLKLEKQEVLDLRRQGLIERSVSNEGQLRRKKDAKKRKRGAKRAGGGASWVKNRWSIPSLSEGIDRRDKG
ncbi:hypothetical protein CDAR_591561 [Caerostris darwini]|uniref:Uncharacterized protein n=1 Tax=Caerostris darwini TaxID=1538125 RepID=A0AAV4PH85_9ARAC|nr:hypothetical protein CDAR_591561 [Caerostris darwini]